MFPVLHGQFGEDGGIQVTFLAISEISVPSLSMFDMIVCLPLRIVEGHSKFGGVGVIGLEVTRLFICARL